MYYIMSKKVEDWRFFQDLKNMSFEGEGLVQISNGKHINGWTEGNYMSGHLTTKEILEAKLLNLLRVLKMPDEEFADIQLNKEIDLLQQQMNKKIKQLSK